MATHNYKDLKIKYDHFQHPISVLTIGGKDIAKNTSGIVVSDLEVELTSGYEASIATFCLYNTFDNDTAQFRTEEIRDYIYIGSGVEIAFGYEKEVREVFCGFISRVNFFYEAGDMPGIRVTAMDVKGVMMANCYSRQLTASSFGEAVKEILNQGPYFGMTTSRLITGIEVSDTPDKTMNTSGGAKTLDRTIEMVSESDYEFVVKAAKKYNYEFFTECGTVYFRKAKQNAEVVMKMSPAEGLRNFDVEYDVTGLVETIKARSTDVSKGTVIEAKQKFNQKISMGNRAQKLIKKSEKVYVDATITSKEEAEYRVASLMEEMSYRLGTLQCTCIGMPELVPGKFLELRDLGEPVDNLFYLTKVIHKMDSSRGYETIIYGKTNRIGE